MVVPDRGRTVSATIGGVTYGFCSERCRGLFLEVPDRYLASVHAGEAVALH
jgi:YHS domain-containing protein